MVNVASAVVMAKTTKRKGKDSKEQGQGKASVSVPPQ